MRRVPTTPVVASLCALALVLTVALALAPATATPAGRIAVSGTAAGTHLRLAVDGDRLVVDGRLAERRALGCHPRRRGLGVVCRLAGVGRMDIETGPAGDYVEVLDPLPFALTVRLGGGSDKFVGNDEPDTCYPQGSRRNRCVGGGGDDVCITGPRNSDCVGGPGNDYCRHRTGSDGCWGGRGRDVCVMGPGEDGCHGGPGDDRLYGGPDPDQLYGGPGFDYCDGGPGRGRSHGCEAGPRR